jgi:hypothetical protein
MRDRPARAGAVAGAPDARRATGSGDRPMGYSFIHVEVYARSSPAKAKARHWTVREIVAEAGREAGHHPHIVDARPPVLVYGEPLAEVEAAAVQAASMARDNCGRRLRKDAPILLAGVTSFPVCADNMNPDDRAAYAGWEQDAIGWLCRTYGPRLKAVIRHEDEGHGTKPAYLHLHFLVIPDLVAGDRIEAVHPGRAAVAAARASGVRDRRELNRRFCVAMRGLQDRFHEGVGMAHGLTRRGPGRRRLSRADWLAEQQAAARTAAVMRKNDRAEARLAQVDHDNFRLALDAAQAVHELRQAERERDEARREAECRGAALSAEQVVRQKAEAALASERKLRECAETRAKMLQRMLAEAQGRVTKVAIQATSLLRATFDPARSALLPRRPDWLTEPDWMAFRGWLSRTLRRTAPTSIVSGREMRARSARREAPDADRMR